MSTRFIRSYSTGLVLPSADYDYSSFFLQETSANFPTLSNSTWTTTNIPTRKLIEDNTLAGVDHFQNGVCQQITTGDGAGTSTNPQTYNFCPPMCTNSCANNVTTKTLAMSGAVFGDPIFVSGNVLQTLENSDTRLAYGNALSKSNFPTITKNTPITDEITLEGNLLSLFLQKL